MSNTLRTLKSFDNLNRNCSLYRDINTNGHKNTSDCVDTSKNISTIKCHNCNVPLKKIISGQRFHKHYYICTKCNYGKRSGLTMSGIFNPEDFYDENEKKDQILRPIDLVNNKSNENKVVHSNILILFVTFILGLSL